MIIKRVEFLLIACWLAFAFPASAKEASEGYAEAKSGETRGIIKLGDSESGWLIAKASATVVMTDGRAILKITGLLGNAMRDDILITRPESCEVEDLAFIEPSGRRITARVAATGTTPSREFTLLRGTLATGLKDTLRDDAILCFTLEKAILPGTGSPEISAHATEAEGTVRLRVTYYRTGATKPQRVAFTFPLAALVVR